MSLDLVKYTEEIVEFINAETLKAIDWGILDLSHVKNMELKRVLRFVEEALTMELEKNYLENDTGIFRVSLKENLWVYEDSEGVIESDCILKLKKEVIKENKIWYVFDELSYEIIGGKCVKR